MSEASRGEVSNAVKCLACPAWGAAVMIIACTEDPVVSEKILTHLDAKAVEPGAARFPVPGAGCSTASDDPKTVTWGCVG